ncbi:MAG: hypothetical protein KBB04_11605 [Methanothrix sp.]|jgi:transcription initiation factor TFIID TATA-box-binding protein|uniref:hypothetical protein n=1 Tax=Methanothrix sp. TaxID=90426 RepID=UPI001B44A283|nr:hypothetical protein [Methanothrix sp.]MBP7068905.1 hypothetical protein [Methanothrix sp.]
MIVPSKHRIVNIIASTDVGDELNLDTIKMLLDNCEYEPEIYYLLVYRLLKPKLSILVNKSGKILFTGATSLEDIIAARDLFFYELGLLGYNPIKNDILIHNIVFCAEIGRMIDIDTLSKSKSENDIKYNPKTFPGLILKNKNPKFTATIFKSGKIIIVGLKNFDEIFQTLKLLNRIIPS